MAYFGWKPYVRVGARQRRAALLLDTLEKKGKQVSPVTIRGRTIAATFWGKAWCDNLERYSDYANRLPRGRTYVRNGSVLDLQVAAGKVTALVSGTRVYDVEVDVAVVPKLRWKAVCRDCAGAIDSVVELLQGRLSTAVMARLCEPATGLFPSPKEIAFRCSCPDWASMCKHVAAVLYGIGARLDERPDLLFLLRQVDQHDLIAKAGSGLNRAGKGLAPGKVLDTGNLSEIFGIELASAEPTTAPLAARKRTARRAETPKAPAAAQKPGTRSRRSR